MEAQKQEVPAGGAVYTNATPAYPPAAMAQPGVVVRHVETNFGSVPVITTCPSCKKEIKTDVELSCGAYATCCVFILLVNFCIPCAIAPCVMDSFKDKTHTCPNCHFVISKKGGNIQG